MFVFFVNCWILSEDEHFQLFHSSEVLHQFFEVFLLEDTIRKLDVLDFILPFQDVDKIGLVEFFKEDILELDIFLHAFLLAKVVGVGLKTRQVVAQVEDCNVQVRQYPGYHQEIVSSELLATQST